MCDMYSCLCVISFKFMCEIGNNLPMCDMFVVYVKYICWINYVVICSLNMCDMFVVYLCVICLLLMCEMLDVYLCAICFVVYLWVICFLFTYVWYVCCLHMCDMFVVYLCVILLFTCDMFVWLLRFIWKDTFSHIFWYSDWLHNTTSAGSSIQTTIKYEKWYTHPCVLISCFALNLVICMKNMVIWGKFWVPTEIQFRSVYHDTL